MKQIYLIIGLMFTLTACDKSHNASESRKKGNSTNINQFTTDSKGLSKVKAIIKTVHGNITFKFYPKDAPNTSTRISHLIKKGFYDGITFHRVIKNFVVQAGDPTGTGTSGSGVKLKAEFNNRQHIRGTVAMARAGNDVDSADSQFYIALSTLPHLNGKYTVFGQVIDGDDILDKIAKGDKILSMVISDK